MSKDEPGKGRYAAQWLPWAGIALATPFLVWFVVGDLSLNSSPYLSHEYGPYDVGPEWSGHMIGAGAAAVALAAVGMLVIRTRRGFAGLGSWAVAVLLATAGALGASGWRTLTAGFTGDGLGGAFVWLTYPWLIAVVLVGAVWFAETGDRRKLTVAAVLVAPALYAVITGLGRYDDSAGLINGRQYADVKIGQTRPAVHERLGREGHEDLSIYSIFPDTPAGLRCDYYDETNGGHAYQFCFRADVLVSKDLRKYPVGG